MPDETPPTPSPTPSERRAATARKWRRRIVRVIVVIIILVLAFRALIHVIFPPVLRSVAGIYGLTAQYDKLDMYMFGGDMGLWGLKITPKEGGQPVLSAGYVRGSISLWALLRGHLKVDRAEAEDADLVLERTADGKLPLVERFIGSTKTPPTTAPASSGGKLSLEPPLSITALRLQNARLHIRDAAVTPATDLTVALDLLVRDIGSLERKTHVEMEVTSPQALGVLSVQADGQSRNGLLEAEFSARMFGLNLLPAKAYLAPLGLVPTENNLQGAAAGDLTARLTQPVAATTTQPAVAGELSAQLHLHDLRLNADSSPAVAVKGITIDAPSLISSTIHVKEIAVNGVRLFAQRTVDRRVQFAGIELASAKPAPATQPAVVSNASTSAAMPSVTLDQLAIDDTKIEFVDNAFATPNRVALDVPKLVVNHVSTDPASASSPATFSLNASAPGIARMIEAEGQALIATPEKSVDATLHVSGIHPKAAEPYLAPLGIHSTLIAGDFKCRLHATGSLAPDGAITASLKLTDTALANAGQTLFALQAVEVQQATLDPTTAKIHIGTIAIDGPTLPITRDASSLGALGFRYEPATAKPDATPATSPSSSAASLAPSPNTQPAPMLTLPTVALDHFQWHNADFGFTDTSSDTPLNLGLKDISVDADHLVFDSAATTPTPGTIKASFDAPGLFNHVEISGHLTPTGNSVAFDLKGQSTGITVDRLRPMLQGIHIEPMLKQGALRFTANGSMGQADRQIVGDFSMHDVAFTDGDTHWLSLSNLKVNHATFDGRTAAVQSVVMDAPLLRVERDAKGILTIAGVKLLPVPPQPVLKTTAGPESPTQVDLTLPIIARLDHLGVQDAALIFHDDDVLPAGDVSAKVSVTADHLVAGVDAPASPFTVDLASPGLIDDLKLSGTLLTNPHHQAINLTAAGTGIQGKALEPYLPSNIGLNLHNGTLAAKLSASIEPNPQGGSTASLSVTDASLKDGTSPEPLGAIGALRLNVDRVDLPAKLIAIKEIAVEGANLSATQDANGFSLLGLTLAPSPLRAEKPAPASTEPVASKQASNVAALTAQARQTPPVITIDKLSLAADRLSVKTTALGEPLVVTGASLTNSTPISLLGQRPSERKPFDLSVRASVVDAIDSIAVNAHLAPFANDPSAKATLSLNGIRGESLTKFLPQLQNTLNANDLKDGRFTTTAEAQFGFTRRGAFGIDLSRDVTATFDVKNVALTEAGDPKVLAGVDSIHGESLRYSPASGSLILKALEIEKPAAQIVRDAQGIHAMGLTIAAPAPTTQPTVKAVSMPSTQPAPHAMEVTPSSKSKHVAKNEMRIDRLTISGIDLTIEDRLGKPPTILPINQLDMEVKGLSTAALTEPNKPIRFDAIVGAGKVLLPPRNDAQGNKPQEREVFSQASANGNITLVPKPNGYVKASLSGLEMTAIRGLASEYGITLGGGTFDVRVDARMNGGDSFTAKVFPTFNELRMKEVPNGPVQSLFKLPAPPDVVISTLEDADGSITFPVDVPINAGKLDTGAVIGSAVGAVGKVVTDAMIAAPLKAAKLVAMLGGADVSSNRMKGLEPVSIEYAPGESQLSSEQLNEIQPVIDKMKDDPTIQVTIQHTLGQADLALAQQRANPLAEDSRGLAENLRQKKFDLQRQQAQAGVRLRVAMATDDPAAQKIAADNVRAVSTQVKENGDDLDQLLDLLSPGASRQADRRTRAAAILLGNLRLRAMQQALLASDLPDINDRVRRANALFNPDAGGKPGTITLVLTRQAKQ